MKKILTLILILFIFTATSVIAQTIHTMTQGHEQDLGDDSTSFSHIYYFDIPEKTKLDTTAQLMMWVYSSDGAAHISINYKYAFNVSNRPYADSASYKLGPNDTELSSDYLTEGVSAWTIQPHANDYPKNDADLISMYNAVVFTIAGVAANRADTKYALKLAFDIDI